ncbi:MAG TPA: FAD-dependent monooxygenase [Pseudonocardia sp.]|jgi:2-polyprenyl-6-methoxyphenol hydroxylase-like FAD-dependent oxidoreductase|nr:FAD-dependent monooxygenase [Pseudonocardia sp.]
MKISCIGAGPAGLYFAISAKRRDPAHHITVYERAAEGATYGWGVVYWDNLLDTLYRNDMESARRIRAASQLWQEQDISLHQRSAYLAGYGYSITRAALIEILTARARALGVEVLHNQDTTEPSHLHDADIVVAADGAASTVRREHQGEFGTQLTHGRNRYIWLGTNKLFNRFTFAFQRTDPGWLWFHAYPSSADTSTCIIECTEETWQAHGFAARNADDTTRLLEKIFHDQLDGHSLISGTTGPTARWQQFLEVSNSSWYHDNLVLLGDAAHTTHFTIGSGTRLAMIDAIALAHSIYENRNNPTAALRTYDQRRRLALESTQMSARASMDWFENIEHYLDQNAVDFAYSMSSRQGEQPPWRYQKHLANQIVPTRLARRHYNNILRWHGAARRGQTPLLPAPLLRPITHNNR